MLKYLKMYFWAKKLNKGWKPNWKDQDEVQYYVYASCAIGLHWCIMTFNIDLPNVGCFYFKDKETAEKFIVKCLIPMYGGIFLD